MSEQAPITQRRGYTIGVFLPVDSTADPEVVFEMVADMLGDYAKAGDDFHMAGVPGDPLGLVGPPELEAADLAASLRKGIAEAKAGRTVDLGDFSQYLEEE